MNIIQFVVRLMFCGVPAMAVAVIPYFFEPNVGIFLFVLVFAFGWQMTKPNPKRNESWKNGQSRYRKRDHWRA